MYNYETLNQELYHYGVKGMKWGVRRKSQEVLDARSAYRSAKKDYNKAFNKAYNRAIAAYSPIKKHRQANDARWTDAANKAEALRKAKTDYKNAKQADKTKNNVDNKAVKETMSEFQKERQRQKQHIARKHAITAGTAFVNNYLQSQGKNMRVDDIGYLAKYALDKKYTRDTFN